MKKTLIKRIVFGLVFFLTIIIIDQLLNKKNADISREMLPATLPVMSVQMGEYTVNTMYGYTEARKVAYTRDSLTPISMDRMLNLVIDTFGTEVEQISYEVRSIDGERLIEGGEISEYLTEEDRIWVSLQLKDLIEEKEEYSFAVILILENGQKVNYYTRFIQSEDFLVKEKLDYIDWFHDTIYSNSTGEELRIYLESDSQGDNSSFHKVDIHSSLKQIMWDELDVERMEEAQVYIRDISASTISVVMEYTVSSSEGREETYYRVKEYYRIRYTPNRTYLLDYERTAGELFPANRSIFSENRIRLGINSPEFVLEETAGGKILAFISGNRIFSYNTVENKLAAVYSFYDKSNFDVRTLNHNSSIQLLNIEEGGNLTFMVSGYMNRGHHEGRVGIAVYYYDSARNLVEEQIFIPYEKSADILMKEVENLSYLNVNNHIFLILEGNLYDIDLATKKAAVIVSGLTEDNYKVSESGRMIVWKENRTVSPSSSLVWMNLNDGEKKIIRAGVYEDIQALGFMGEDLVYGLARKNDVSVEYGKNILIPLYQVRIENQDKVALKTYQKEGIYVTDCIIEENQITLERVEKLENGEYRLIADDHISSSDPEDGNINRISTATLEVYGTIIQITLKSPADTQTLKVLTPREVIYEGRREVVLTETEELPYYYVNGPYGVEKITISEAEAVSLAYDISGTVTDQQGQYIWKKGTVYTRNQIMAIQGQQKSQERSALAVCLDTILELEGISRLTQPMLDRGEDTVSILERSLRQAQILNLTGCSLDTVLHYPDQDIPVLALLGEEDAVLIIGFNEQNVVLMDPATGEVYKKGMNDSRELFEESGNRFITYVRATE